MIRIESLVEPDDEYPWQPRLLNAKYYEAVDFERESIVFVIISTAGDGKPLSKQKHVLPVLICYIFLYSDWFKMFD